MPKVLRSRKLWAAIVGLALIVVNAFLNQQQVDPDTLTNAIMGIIAAYMAAVAFEDGMAKKNANKTTIETPSENIEISTSEAKPKPTITSSGLL